MLKTKNIFKFSKEQKEILIGLILGDGHLEQMSSVTYRLKIEQSFDKKDYLYHLYDIFKDFCSAEPILNVKPNGNKSFMFQTKTSISLNFYGKQFYKDEIKIIPKKLLHRLLTAKSLAYWYMDNGSIKSKASRGTILNTQGFSKLEILYLIKLLNEKFCLDCKIRKQKAGFQIYISGKSYNLLKTLIYDLILDSMKYKFPEERKIKLIENSLKSNGEV